MGCREVHVLVPLTMQGLCQGCQDLTNCRVNPRLSSQCIRSRQGGREREREREKRRYVNLLHVTLQNAHTVNTR